MTAVASFDHLVELLWHGMLLVFSAPCQLPLLTGQEHGRTIPLSDILRVAPPPAWLKGKESGKLCVPPTCPECSFG